MRLRLMVVGVATLAAACRDSAEPTHPAIVTIVLAAPAALGNGSNPSSTIPFAFAFDHAHITLLRPTDTTVVVADTTVAFTLTSPMTEVRIAVAVVSDGQLFDVRVGYLNGQSLVFLGRGTVASHRPDQSAPASPGIPAIYVGPGATGASDNATVSIVALGVRAP